MKTLGILFFLLLSISRLLLYIDRDRRHAIVSNDGAVNVICIREHVLGSLLLEQCSVDLFTFVACLPKILAHCLHLLFYSVVEQLARARFYSYVE